MKIWLLPWTAARKADVVILALGEDAGEMTGEAASRAHLGLPGRQQELLEKVVATGKPVVLILFSGRPLTAALGVRACSSSAGSMVSRHPGGTGAGAHALW